LTTEGADQTVEIRCTDGGRVTSAANVAGFSIDRTPPNIACPSSPANLWPADGRAVVVSANVQLHDSVSGPKSFALASATASGSQADIAGFSNATFPASGNTRPAYGNMRAISGEQYTLVFQGNDMAGNATSCTTTIAVQQPPVSSAAVDIPANAWSPVQALPTPRSYLAATTDQNGRIYAIGGRGQGGDTLPSVEAYDSLHGWSTLPPLSFPRDELAAATDGNGLIYAIGGDDGITGTAKTVEVFDPNNPQNLWMQVGDLHTDRRNLAAVTDTQGRVYAIGGYSDSAGGKPVPDVERYDPISRTWSELPQPLPVAESRLAAALGPDGLIYVIGGGDCSSGPCSATQNVYAYDPAGGQWSMVKPLQTQRAQVAAVATAGARIYALAGSQFLCTSRSCEASGVDAYDVSTGNWADQSPLPAPREGLAVAAGKDGLLYVIGGTDNSVDVLDRVEVYDPARNTRAP
jgi:N-acetylneuraminic acid mutarotase